MTAEKTYAATLGAGGRLPLWSDEGDFDVDLRAVDQLLADRLLAPPPRPNFVTQKWRDERERLMPRKPIGEVAMTGAERMRRLRANQSKAAKAKRRAQRRHAYAEQNEDAYFTCSEAGICLLHLERPYLPRVLLEPCAGDGAISILLQRAGYDVTTFDIRDHGLPGLPCSAAVSSLDAASCRDRGASAADPPVMQSRRNDSSKRRSPTPAMSRSC